MVLSVISSFECFLLLFIGYSGLNCQEEKSDCRNDTCPERAMCKDEPGLNNFTCLCRSGYTGPNCDITVSRFLYPAALLVVHLLSKC